MNSSRLSYNPRDFEEDNQYRGIMIGGKVDEKDIRNQKLIAQRLYRKQLEDDKYVSPIETERKPSARRRAGNNIIHHTEAEEDNYLHIGSFDAYQKENQRRLALEIALQNREEAYLKLLENASNRREGRNLREVDQRIFEDSQNAFIIGSDEKELKEANRRRAMDIMARNREDSYLRSIHPDAEDDLSQRSRQTARRYVDKEMEQTLFENSPQQFNIGYSEEKLKEDRRRAARELIERSKEDLYYKESSGDSLEVRRRLSSIDKEFDQRKFEDAEYKAIGSLVLPSPRHSKLMFVNNRNADEFSQLMGGMQTNFDHVAIEDKYAKQAEYKLLLDSQRRRSQELGRLELEKY